MGLCVINCKGLCDAGFLREKDMAKQNKKKRFADKTQQNGKTKETVRKETNNEQRPKKRKKNISGLLIWLIPTALFLANILYACFLCSWSTRIGKSSVCLASFADAMESIAMIITNVFLLIGAVIFAFFRKKEAVCAAVSVIMVVLLYGLVAVNLKVASSVSADQEESFVVNLEKSMEVLSYIQNLTVNHLQQYIPEEDLFMENMEQYCGIADNDISQDERSGMMAAIILSALKRNVVGKTEKELPYNYETNVLLGNELYRCFLFWIEKSEKKENSSIINKIYGCALYELEEAIKCKIEADDSLQTAENRRLIGVCYIDAGDFYQKMDEIDTTIESYENAAEWAVKSIHSAAIENDVKAMNDAWDVLNDAADRIEVVEGSSDADNVQAIKDIRDAYRIVIDHWEE